MKRIAKKISAHASELLEPVENRLISADHEPSYSPIFIIGVPRSGTTLLYQIITYCFNVCYISNLVSRRFSNIPCVASYPLSLINGCNYPGHFKSWYGHISGWRAPSQAWKFWERWFPFEDQRYIRPEEISGSSIKKMRNTVLLMQDIYRRPFVNKTLNLGVRLLPLNRAFPEALFVRMRRNRIDIAQSILKGRKEYNGDINEWFSAKPLEFDRLSDKDYITQVCGQIYYLEMDMDRDIQRIGSNRCIDVQYEYLCRNPKGVIAAIKKFYNHNTCGERIEVRNNPPRSFRPSNGQKCSDDEYRRLKKYLRDFGGLKI
jgi:hypothetical protein